MINKGDVYYCESVDMIVEVLYIDEKNGICLMANDIVNGKLSIEKGPIELLESTNKILIDKIDSKITSADLAGKIIKTNILFNKKNLKDLAAVYFIHYKTAMYDVGDGQFIYVYTDRQNQKL